MRLLLRILIAMVLVPVTYALLGLVLGMVPVNRNGRVDHAQTIYLSTNGVHLHLILPRDALSPALLADLPLTDDTQHVAFGWGDAEFYLNTPEWKDLTVKRAVVAALLPSRSLVHVTRYRYSGADWTVIPVSMEQLDAVNDFLLHSFRTDSAGRKQLIPGAGYGTQDDFLEGKGSYTALRTCNTWVNDALKHGGLPACLWTPFDFSVLRLYQQRRS